MNINKHGNVINQQFFKIKFYYNHLARSLLRVVLLNRKFVGFLIERNHGPNSWSDGWQVECEICPQMLLQTCISITHMLSITRDDMLFYNTYDMHFYKTTWHAFL